MKKILGLALAVSLITGALTGGGLASPAQAATTPSAGELQAARQTILAQTNQARAEAGLPPVVLDSTINAQAQDCATWQATVDYKDNNRLHCNVSNGYTHNFADGFPAGYTTASENAAFGQPVDGVVASWLGSSGHEKNIIATTVNRMGVGYMVADDGTTYFTQNFGAYQTPQTVPAWVGLGGTANPSTTPNAADLMWATPIYDGHSPITGYEIVATPNNGAATVTKTVTTQEVTSGNLNNYTLTGLVGGTTYNVTVAPINAIGKGVTYPGVDVTPIGVPTLTVGTITAQPYDFTITWTGEAHGTPITGYKITTGQLGNINLPASANSHTFEGGTPGQYVSGSIIATSALGDSEPVPFSLQLPAIAPDAATASAVVENKTNLRVNWIEPNFDGGAQITEYTVNLYSDTGLVSNIVVNGNTFSTLFEGLIRGNEYRYEVVATNSAGSTTSANNTTITLPFTAPTAVQTATAELTDEQTITLNWISPEDNGGTAITNYVIQVVKNGSVVSTQTVTGNATTYTFDSTVIDPSSTYTFIIRAVNARFDGPNTSTNQVIVPATPVAPGIVANLDVANVTANDGFLILWDTPTDNGGAAVTNYEWEIYKTSQPTVGDSGSTTDTQVQLAWSSPGTTYTVRVRAENVKGWGSWTETVTTTPANPTSIPYLVTPFGATTPTTGILQVGVIDDGGDPNITYTVNIFDVTDNKNLTTLTTTSEAEGKVNITGLISGHAYKATVTALNSGGISPEGEFLFSAPAVSDAVENLTTGYNNNKIITTWDSPSDTGGYSLTGYLVEYFDDVTGAPIENVTLDENTTEHTALLTKTSKLQWGATYKVTITPVTGTFNLKGEATTVTVPVPARVPFPVKNVRVTVNTGNVNVIWDAPDNDGGANINGYHVALYDGDTNEIVFDNVNTTLTRNIELPKNNKNYYIKVSAINNAGAGDTTNLPQFNSGNFVPTAPEVALNVNSTTGVVTINTTVTDDGGTAITGYIHTVNNDTDGTVLVPTTETANGTATFNGEFGKTYTVTVNLRNSMGVSESVTETVTVPLTNPDKVTNVKTVPTTDSVTVTWENPTFTGGYGTQIELTTITIVPVDGGETITATASYDDLTATFTGLNEYTDYVVTISVANGEGKTSVETSNSFATLLSPANAPDTVNLNVTETVGTVFWDASTGGPASAENRIRYNVEIVNMDTNKTIQTFTDLTATFAIFNDLPRGVNVAVKVTAYYTGFNNTTSETKTSNTVLVPVAPPSVPRNLNLTWDRLMLTADWLAPTDNGGAPVSYNVTLLNINNGQVVTDDVTNGLSYGFPELEPNTDYQLQVKATNVAGESTFVGQAFTTALVEPTAPLNVSSEATDRNIITTWDAPASNGGGTVAYDVKVWEINPDGADKLMVSATVNNGEYSYNGTTRGKNYYVTVTAVNTAGVSPTATSNDVFITPVSPSKVTNVKVNVAKDNKVVISWGTPVDNGGSPIRGYNIVVKDTTGQVVHSTLNITGTTTTIPAGTLNPNVNYTVQVQAVTSYGSSVETSQFTTNIVAASIPQNVNLAVNQTDAVLSVKFNKSVKNGGDENVTYTARLFDADGNQIWVNLNATPGVVETIGTFARGVEYKLTVEAVNQAGNSPAANATATINAVVPANPTNLTVTDTSTLTEASAKISWTAPGYNGGAAITGYNWTLLEGNKTVNEGNVTGTTLTLNSLSPNSVYSIQITAVNRVGESSPLNGINMVITPVILPKTGTITTTSTSNSIGFVATVNGIGGDEDSNITTRVSLFTKDNMDTPVEVIEGDIEGLTGSFTGLTHATNYVLKYDVTNTVGSTTTTVDVKTAPVASNAVTDVQATIAGQTSANVSWTAPTDDGGTPVTSYLVKWSNVENTVTGNVKVNAPVTKTTISGLPAGNLFTFTVTATNQAGNSPVSDASNEVESVPANTPTLLDEKTFNSLLDGLVGLEVTIKGNVATVTVPTEWDQEWFYGAVYSTPVGLDWDDVKNGTLVYTLPAGIEAGNHHVAVYDNTGTLIGAAPFTIETATTTPPVVNNTGETDKTNGNETRQTMTGTKEKAENTGGPDGQLNWLLWVSLGILLAGGGLVLATSTRNRNKHEVS